MKLIKYLLAFVPSKKGCAKKVELGEQNSSAISKIDDAVTRLEVFESNAISDIEHGLKRLAENNINLRKIVEKNPEMAEKIKLGIFAQYIKIIHELKSKLLCLKERRELLKDLI